MPRSGLNRELVADASIALIEECGAEFFTVNELARRLGVKPASMYNHIENIESLTGEVGYRIGSMIRNHLLEAIAGKHRDEALFALCFEFRNYVKSHIELYKVIMGMQKDKNSLTEKTCGQLIEPILAVLSDYKLTENEIMHWQRILRALMDGFITHEHAGEFKHFPLDSNDTYKIALEAVIVSLHSAEKE